MNGGSNGVSLIPIAPSV